MKYSKNPSQLKSFKKRTNNGYMFRYLRYGNTGVFFSKNNRIENIYLFDLKKKFKFFLVKQKKGFNKRLWIFIQRNYPISKKSKNSRMGKGVGKFLRLCTRVKKNSTFLEFLNINPVILKKVLHYFSKKTNIHFNFIYKNNNNVFWKKKQITYFKEYNRF
jgi:ribosomal protein L16/L10AE